MYVFMFVCECVCVYSPFACDSASVYSDCKWGSLFTVGCGVNESIKHATETESVG